MKVKIISQPLNSNECTDRHLCKLFPSEGALKWPELLEITTGRKNLDKIPIWVANSAEDPVQMTKAITKWWFRARIGSKTQLLPWTSILLRSHREPKLYLGASPYLNARISMATRLQSLQWKVETCPSHKPKASFQYLTPSRWQPKMCWIGRNPLCSRKDPKWCRS